MNYRLSTALYPYHYTIMIQPYFKPTTEPVDFDGHVAISFQCLNNTNQLVLHYLGLELTSSTLRLNSSTDTAFSPMQNFAYSYDSVTHKMTVQLTETNQFRINNNYTFAVSYKGKPATNNLGLFNQL